ncbi:MAG: cytochrome c biogenesis protein CcsA, partial [Fibrobacteria bacterium]|nr:cytochrome c biogenesis protein CcsA [Fibrobacteria bacterium]
SNFWLATHVTTITMGYAGCCAAGVIGHIYIIQALFLKDKAELSGASVSDSMKLIPYGYKEKLQHSAKAIYGMLAFGTVFTFLGTVLGGIWADQSWGRFWGWDPKENGALLIIIWCCILFHARLAGHIKQVGMAIGSIIGIIVVMFAWFGVNLLGVGLHSYGFSNGILMNLIIFILAESLFIAITLPWLLLKQRT